MSDKREAILAATLRLVSERGFHDAPMSLIAREAGVSAGIIYHYFDNKEALIHALFIQAKRDFGAAVSAGYDPALPLREQFWRMMSNAARYYLRHPTEAAFIQQYVNSPFYSAEMEDDYREYFLPVFEFMERALREQVIKPLPDEVLYAFTMEIAGSLAQKHANGILTVTDDLLDEVIGACWDALKR
jgi:AcrR family transcriptional regulator